MKHEPRSSFPTPVMFVCEDPDKFKPGHVVVEDGKPRRLMITKLVVGFAECLWFEKIYGTPRFEIVHTSLLTLHADQRWETPTL